MGLDGFYATIPGLASAQKTLCAAARHSSCSTAVNVTTPAHDNDKYCCGSPVRVYCKQGAIEKQVIRRAGSSFKCDSTAIH